MKQIITILLFVFGLNSGVFVAQALAQDENANRTVNPGDDPNEQKSGKEFEADVAAIGMCRECVTRMKHTRLSDDTTFRPGSGSAKTEDGSPSSDAKGTR